MRHAEATDALAAMQQDFDREREVRERQQSQLLAALQDTLQGLDATMSPAVPQTKPALRSVPAPRSQRSLDSLTPPPSLVPQSSPPTLMSKSPEIHPGAVIERIATNDKERVRSLSPVPPRAPCSSSHSHDVFLSCSSSGGVMPGTEPVRGAAQTRSQSPFCGIPWQVRSLSHGNGVGCANEEQQSGTNSKTCSGSVAISTRPPAVKPLRREAYDSRHRNARSPVQSASPPPAPPLAMLVGLRGAKAVSPVPQRCAAHPSSMPSRSSRPLLENLQRQDARVHVHAGDTSPPTSGVAPEDALRQTSVTQKHSPYPRSPQAIAPRPLERPGQPPK